MPARLSVDKPSAPAPLDLVQAFVNTHALESGRDDLAESRDLAHWFVSQGVLVDPEGFTEADGVLAGRLREGLRDLLWMNCDGVPRPDGFTRLGAVLAQIPVVLRVDDAGCPRMAAARASGIGQALGQIVGAVLEGMLTGRWDRLKACRRCGWIFWDAATNRSGVWCVMGVCGNRAKVSAYRKRRRSMRIEARP